MLPRNPFYHLNSRVAKSEDLLQVRTGRLSEINTLREAVLDYNHNALVYGSRGSGKSFLLRIFEHELIQHKNNILPVFIDVTSLWQRNLNNATFPFTEYVLLSLCAKIWSECFKQPYSRLLSLITGNGGSLWDDLKPNQKAFVDIYRALHAEHFEVQASKQSVYGATAVAKAELRREDRASLKRGGLLPFEFQELLREITSVGLAGSGHVPLVLCDEANLLTIHEQEQLLGSSLSVFNSSGIRFVMVAARLPWEKTPFIPNAFETSIEIEGLSNTTELGEMVSKYAAGASLSILRESIEVLFEFFAGHPRMSLLACYIAAEKGMDEISPQSMTRACLEVQSRIEKEKELNSRE